MVQKSRKIAAKMVQNRGLEEAWAALGAYRSVMVASWGFMGAFWGVLGTSWGLLGGVLGASWGVLGRKNAKSHSAVAKNAALLWAP